SLCFCLQAEDAIRDKLVTGVQTCALPICAEPVIGVNKFVEPAEPAAVPIHRVDPAVEARQVARLRATRATRDAARVAALLDRLAREATDPAVNLMPVTIELVKARASMGEIVGRLRQVWGQYVETPVF